MEEQVNINSKSCLLAMLDKSLSEEYLAVTDYEKRAAKCEEIGNTEAAKLFAELANDERVHVANLTRAKELFGLVDAEAEQHGIEEVDKLLGNIDEMLNEAVEIPVVNVGFLEVPEGTLVDELPYKHFADLVKRKGYAPVVRALTNLEVWNKNRNKKLSTWASDMADKLRAEFRPEEA